QLDSGMARAERLHPDGCIVGRTVVNHDDARHGHTLRGNRLKRRLDVASRIEGRHDNIDPRMRQRHEEASNPERRESGTKVFSARSARNVSVKVSSPKLA